MDRAASAQQVFDLRNQGLTYKQIQRRLGMSHQTLWKIIKSPEYEALVEELEATALVINHKPDLFRSLMKELA